MRLMRFFWGSILSFLPYTRSLAFLAAGLLMLLLRAQAQAPTFTFAGACGVGTANTALVQVAQNVQDAAGNSYVTGSFSGRPAFGAVTLQGNSNNEAFVAKLDPAGNVLWAVQPNGLAAGRGIALDAGGNILITGAFAGTATFGPYSLVCRGYDNVFVAKLSPAGTFLWAVRAGGNNGSGNGIAVDAAGNSYVCGQYSGGTGANAADFGPFRLVSTIFYLDAFAAKLSPAGVFLWANGGGGGEDDEANGIAVDAAGSAYITGTVRGSFSTFVRFGPFTVPVQGEGDLLVAKLTPAGVFEWVKVGGGDNGPDIGRRIALDAQGTIHLVGYFLSGRAYYGAITVMNSNLGSDILTATLTPGGTWQWVVPGGGTGDDYAADLALDAAGNTYVVGSFNYRATFGGTVLTTAGDRDVLVCKLSPAGAYLWALQAGGSGNDQAAGTALSANGTLTLAGDTRSSLAVFGTQGIAADPASITGFVARLAVGPLTTAPPKTIAALALWPNPARAGELVHLAGLTTRQPVTVRDVLGRVVLTLPVPAAGAVEVLLPAGLSSGTYLMQAGPQVRRFSVQ